MIKNHWTQLIYESNSWFNGLIYNIQGIICFFFCVPQFNIYIYIYNYFLLMVFFFI